MVPDLRLPRILARPLWNDPDWTKPRVNHGLTQLTSVPPHQVLTSTLSRCFCLKRHDKVLEAMVREQVVPDHGYFVILSRPGRSGGHQQGLEAIGGREP